MRLPWITVSSSIIVPFSSILTTVDTFYFGLSIASVLSFSSALIIAFFSTFILAEHKIRLWEKLATILLAGTLSVILGYVIGVAAFNGGTVISAHMGAVIDSTDSLISNVVTGSFLGCFCGLGNRTWSIALAEAGYSISYSLILPLLTALSSIGACITIFLHVDDSFPLRLAIVGVITPLLTKLLHSYYRRIRKRD